MTSGDRIGVAAVCAASAGWQAGARSSWIPPQGIAADDNWTMEKVTDSKSRAYRFSVAPMMDWTDTHCRCFHRLMSNRALLYTEMVSASAIVRGETDRLLAHDPMEHPLALQVGGSDPRELSDAVRLCAGRGFSEINLNAGCPSDKVQEGSFGAVLMKDPARTAECLTAMREAAGDTEITLKCRIGVDGQDPEKCLPEFIDAVCGSGIVRIIIHARKAWLKGLSPKQNRTIPPLNHRLVIRMKEEFPHLKICINGGINSLDEAEFFLSQGLDGVMTGRSAYRSPAQLLMDADRRLFGDQRKPLSRRQVMLRMMAHLRRHQESGGRITAATRHMLGLYSGLPGARVWRRDLSNPALNSPQGLRLLEQALSRIEGAEVGWGSGESQQGPAAAEQAGSPASRPGTTAAAAADLEAA